MKKYQIIISSAFLALAFAVSAQTPANQVCAPQSVAPRTDALSTTYVSMDNHVVTVYNFDVDPTGTGGRVSTPVGPRHEQSQDMIAKNFGDHSGVSFSVVSEKVTVNGTIIGPVCFPDGSGRWGTPIKPGQGGRPSSSGGTGGGFSTESNNNLPLLSSPGHSGSSLTDVIDRGKILQVNGFVVIPGNNIVNGGGRVPTPIKRGDDDGDLIAGAVGGGGFPTGTNSSLSSPGSGIPCSISDMDGDGVVSINDVTILVDHLLRGDVIDDDMDIEDVTGLIDMLLMQ